MWHAVLITYYIDASQERLNERDWKILLDQAHSEWTKIICGLISLDHGFFIQNLKRIRKNRRTIKFIHYGLLVYDR